MGKRHKGVSTSDDTQLAQRCFDRGDFRQALKHARQASRKSPSDKVTILLETATMARAEELCRSGHLEQCRELLIPLAATIKSPDLRALLPELLLLAGLIDQCPQFRSGVTEADRHAVEVDVFDRAVVNIAHARTAEAREQAALVRSALEAVEIGNRDAAAEFLRRIPRNSLAADWRYFVRGLSAWYENDAEAVDANWSRLESGRAALRIVEKLTSADSHSDVEQGASTRSAESSLSADESSKRLPAVIRRFGTRVNAALPSSVTNSVSTLRLSDGLREILLKLTNRDWSGVNKAFRQYRPALQQIAPRLLERVALKIVSRIVHLGDERALKDFLPFVDAPADDPHWNRARAILAENQFLEGDGDLEFAENRWRQCLRDMDRISQFSEADKQIARSLLNTRIGRMSLQEIRGLSTCSCGMSHEDDIAELRERAVEFLEHAISACPACIDPWRELNNFYEFLDDSSALNQIQRRMLKQFPEDVNVLVSIGNAELSDGDALLAKDYLLRALRLKPLDETLRLAVAEAHRCCARKFTGVAEFEAARVELNAALSLAGKGSDEEGNLADRVTHTVLLAVLELSAGNDHEAQQLIDAALKMYSEPTVTYLQLAIEAAQVQLPRTTIERFEQKWRKHAAMKCHSQTAGEIARLMSRQTIGKGPEYNVYRVESLAYIKRAGRVRFASPDLRNVCVFLQMIDEEKLFEKHLEKGRRQFPDEAWFHFMAAETEMQKGMHDCNRKIAFAGYSRVLEICEDSPDANDQEMVEASREGLLFLRQVGLAAPRRSMFTPPPGGADSPGIADRIFGVFGGMFGRAAASK